MNFRYRTLASLLLAVLWVSGCRSSRGVAVVGTSATPEAATAEGIGSVVESDIRPVLLLLEDRRLFESVAVETALEADPVGRKAAALALGRLADEQGREPLERLLFDPLPEIQAIAAYALGRIGDRRSLPALSFAARGTDRRTGELAVGALLRIGVEIEELLGILEPLEPTEFWYRLLPPLFRSQEVGKLVLARTALEQQTELSLRRWAAYAMARRPLPQALGDLRSLLPDPDPQIRAWAVRGLGEIGTGEDLERIAARLDDDSEAVQIHALRALRALLADGRAAAPIAWRDRVLELSADARPGVRLTALEALGMWLRDPAVSARLESAFVAGGRGAEIAIEQLAAGRADAAWSRVPEALSSASRALRAAGVRAARSLGAESLLLPLAKDPDDWIRWEALQGLVELQPSERDFWLRLGLSDRDEVVRTVALEALTEQATLPYETIVRAMALPGSARLVDVRTTGAQALRKRAEVEPLERGAIVAYLEELALSSEYAVRRAAATALTELDREPPPRTSLAGARPLEEYRDVIAQSGAEMVLEVVTERGSFTIRLLPEVAPMTSLSFLKLAQQGYFDGLSLHRVVPDFVVQGGDPRGDGWGGPGYTLRDELSPLPFVRGTVGLALSGPDTGGSQLFVTLARQPHLDGEYPVIGEVVEGVELLDQMEQGDRMISVKQVEAVSDR